jgi:membrane protease YdiL (CAAX protease family)
MLLYFNFTYPEQNRKLLILLCRKIINFSRMTQGFFYDARPFTKLLLVLFLMVCCYLIFFGMGILLAMPIFKVPPGEVIQILENNEVETNIGLLKFLQVLYSIGLFLVPAILSGFLIQRNTWKFLKANRVSSYWIIILVITIMIVSIPWINFTSFLNEKLSLPERWGDLMERIRENDENSWDLMKAYLQTDNIGGLLINIFMVALIPAIGEEFLFRGTVQRILSEWYRNEHLAIWTAALLFSLMHYQFLGFIPRVMLGALFGYLFVWTGSIWMAVLAHFINNAVAVIYYYIFYQGTLEIEPDHIGIEENAVLMILASVVLTILCLAIIQQQRKVSVQSGISGLKQ